jgi:ubiquinol-cytochrome c reductase cytochrome c1 subunit
MRELKIFGIVAFFTLVTYYLVEPYAHSVMHKHVEGHDFTYPDLKEVSAKGDAAAGKALAAGCIGCHSIKSQGMAAPMDPVTAAATYGVNPPDLSNAGVLYDEKFLANFLKNPVHAVKLDHKFDPAKGKVFPMPPMATDDKSAADLVAYFKSIAPKELSNKEAFDNACGRCHEMRYAKWTQMGDVPKTKFDIKTKTDPEKMKFDLKLAEYKKHLVNYMGKLPPDLSMIIRARSEKYLETFVEDPQAQLPGTAMPRVGLTKESYEKVRSYLEEIGDSSKPKREATAPWVFGYLLIFAVLAYLWKQYHWRDLH